MASPIKLLAVAQQERDAERSFNRQQAAPPPTLFPFDSLPWPAPGSGPSWCNADLDGSYGDYRRRPAVLWLLLMAQTWSFSHGTGFGRLSELVHSSMVIEWARAIDPRLLSRTLAPGHADSGGPLADRPGALLLWSRAQVCPGRLWREPFLLCFASPLVGCSCPAATRAGAAARISRSPRS